jgi:methyl-accepting chemotaxis protein
MKMKQEKSKMAIDFKERIRRDEREGEVIINYFRLALAIIYVFGMIAISLARHSAGYGYLPWRAYAGTGVFFAYSVFLLFYLRGREVVPNKFKYICVVMDMTIISCSIFITCTYPEVCPPIAFLSIQALFYIILIILGSFRYDIPCAIFSGIYSGVGYFIVIFINAGVIDINYTAIINGNTIDVIFPLYNETFRVMGMIVAGAATGMACKRHLALFRSMIDSESQAAAASAKTVEQTKTMAKTIQQATNEIFLSSKDIFTTANNQASSVQEIESTINENTQIAADIAEKTGSVATIASKTEEDVRSGFSVLEQNVIKMEDIKTKNDSVIAGIVALGNKISKIRDIIKTINTITDQTKVIAFNAALEAASAGDKGKRFSVVASEVNRLADDIAALTKQIREQIEEIQNSSSSLIISSEESADKITEGRKLIKDLEDIFREIKNSAEITSTQAQTITVSTQKQQQSTEQINIAIADISQGLNNFIHSTEVATASAEELTRLIEGLEKLLNTKITADNRDNNNGN